MTNNFLKRWRVPVLVFVFGLALYVPMRTQWAYLLDSVEFALAIQDYDVGLSQPHPPGYFLYVMLGRLVAGFVGDPHASLVWLSVVCGAAFAAILARLAGDLADDEATGVAAGLLALTSPLVWFFSCVALTYVVDAFLATAFVFWCWCAMRRGGRWADVIGLGLMLAVMGGVRQQTLPAMIPLTMFVLWRFRGSRGLKALVLLATAGIGVVVWVSAMAWMTGGLEVYRAAAARIVAFHAHKTMLGGGVDAVLWNVFFAALYCVNGLMLGAAVLMIAALRRLVTVGGSRGPNGSRGRSPSKALDRVRSLEGERPREPRSSRRDAWRVIWLWALPPFLLGMFVGYSEAHGHVFGYLPGLILLVAVALGGVRPAALRPVLVGICCAANTFAFLLWPVGWDDLFFGTARTARELRQHDAMIERLVTTVRDRYPPEQTVIGYLHGDLFLGLRHLHWHLPEYRHVQLTVDRSMVPAGETRYLAAIEGRTELLAREEIPVRPGDTLLLVVAPGLTVESFGDLVELGDARVVTGTDGRLWTSGGVSALKVFNF